MVVIAIVALVLSASIPIISRVTSQRIASETRKFVGRVRTLRNDAILLNSIHRLVIDLESQTWWVEAQQQFKPLTEISEDNPPDEASVSNPNFGIVEKYGNEPNKIPSGLIFQGVYKEVEGLVKEGAIFIHFFPNGFNEFSVIYLNRKGSEARAYAIEISPPSGRVELFREDIEDAGKKS